MINPKNKKKILSALNSGLSLADVAALIGCHPDDLSKSEDQEILFAIQHGKEKARATLQIKLFELLDSPDKNTVLKATQFLAKIFFKEFQKGAGRPPGRPTKSGDKKDLAEMSNEDLAAIAIGLDSGSEDN